MKPNRKNPILLASLTFALTLAAPSAFATNLYWDTNGTGAAGSGAATGTWGTSIFWSTDSTGANVGSPVLTATTTGVDDLFFSAGTNGTGGTVTVNSTQTARLLTLEEGALTFSGGTISLAGGGGITVLAGAGNATISSNLTVSGNNIFNVGDGRTLTLQTGTFTRSAGATINIRATGTGSGSSTMTGLSSNVNNIIGPWASLGTGTGTTYAQFNGTSLSGLNYSGGANGTSVNATSLVVSTALPGTVNYSLALTTTSGTASLPSGANVNTLRFRSSATASPGNFALVLNTSFTTKGIMNVSGQRLDFNTNSGNLTSGSSDTEMVVNAANGEIRFVGTGSVTGSITKTGSSALTFGAPNFSGIGAITVNEGVLTTNGSTDNSVVGATINSGGTLTWSASNKHRDDAVFTINAGGILNLNAQTDTIGSISGAGSITGTNGSSMILSGGTQAFSGVIGGAVSLALNLTSSSALTLSGNNTFTGGVTINAGTLTLANVGALNSTAGSENAVAFGASSTGTLALGGNSVVIRSLNSNATPGTPVVENANAGNATLNIGNSLNLASSFAGIIRNGTGGGTLALTKAGTNTLTLSGDNSYTGATLVSAGTLTLASAGDINSTSGITISGSGAKFLQTSSVAVSPIVTLTQGTLTGSGTVNTVNVGAGTGGIISNNNGVGGAALTIGNLSLAGAANLNLFSNSFSSNLDVTGTLTTAATPATLTANNVGGWTNGTAYTLLTFGGGAIAGSGGNFTKVINNLVSRQSGTWNTTSSAITLTLSGDNPVWSGANGGTWTTQATDSPTSGTPNWALKNAPAATDFWVSDIAEFNDTYDIGGGPLAPTTTTVDISTANVSPGSTTFNNATLNYTLNSSGGFGIATGSLTKNGAGSLTISSVNTYTGATTINAGTIMLSGSGTLGTGSALTLGGGKLDLGGLSRTVGAVSVTAPAASGDTIGNGSLTGTSYAASNTTGDAIISANLLVNGGAGFAKTGAGTVTLSGTNTYTGTTSIGAGTLKLSGAGTPGLAGSDVAVSDGALLDLNGTNQNIKFIAGTGVGTVANNSGSGTSILTLAANPAANVLIQDYTTTPGGKVAVVITVNSSGLSATNTYSGGTTVNAGAYLYVTTSDSQAGTGPINLTAGTGSTATSSGLLVNGGTYANDITGAGYVHINANPGTAVFTGTLNTSGTFNFRNIGVSVYNFAGSGNSTLSGVIGPAGAAGVYGPNTTVSTGRIIKSGAGTLTLSNPANLYSGSTTIAEGILNANSTGALGSGGASNTLIFTGGTLQAGGSIVSPATRTVTLTSTGLIDTNNNAVSIAGIMSGEGGLTKSGLGILTLSGANTYTGATTISAGTLLVNGSTHASSAVTVAAGTLTGTPVATLGGNGTINGTLNMAEESATGFKNGGVLAPGGSGVDIKTLNAGTTTWNGGSIWNFDLSSSNNTSDQLAITGDLVKGTGSGFEFDFMGSTPAWNTTYTLVTWSSLIPTNFSLGDFSFTNLGAGPYSTSSFTLNATSLTFTAVPEPTSALAGLLLTAGLLRRRRK